MRHAVPIFFPANLKSPISNPIDAFILAKLDEKGLRPSPPAAVRLLGGFFSAALFFLGFFWAGWSADRQSWHDKIAGTVVIRNPKSTPLL